MKMQMYAQFKLYRKNKETGYFNQITEDDLESICPGGFTFEIGGKSVPFDFDAEGTHRDNGLFTYESGYGPFFNDFELTDCFDEDYEQLGLKREDITPEFLASVTNIEDFYIDFQLVNADKEEYGIGDNSDADAEFLIELLSISFEERDTGKVFTVDEKVVAKFNGKIVSYSDLLSRAYEEYKKEWCEVRGYSYEDVQKAEANDEEYNGEMYVCKNEFEDCEFQDDDYIAAHIPDYFEMKIVQEVSHVS